MEQKEGESLVVALFIMDAMWPQGAADIRWNRITSSLTKFLHIVERKLNLERLIVFGNMIKKIMLKYHVCYHNVYY